MLLLDEPASGLDPRARIEIRELLKELHRMGKTIIISSHILHELAELCTTVGIIEQGELKFKELRARAERALGDRFDVRTFHDACLENGAIPLDILDRHINEWIAAQ